VSNVTVASPTTLFADITISGDTVPGLHDVTVTNNGTYTLTQAFQVESPIEVSFQGDVAQGGIPYFTVNNHDFDTPFDLTQDGNDAYTNLILTAPTGVTMQISSATAYELKGFAFIDTDATPGTFSIVSGPAMKTTSFNLGANLDVLARTPEALSGPVTGTLANTGDSKLYSINVPSSPSLVRIGATSSNQDAAPAAVLLPNGHWDEAINASLAIVDATGTVPVTVFDGGTAGGYNFSISAKAEALTEAAEGTDGTTSQANALVAAGLPYALSGSLSAANDKDYVKITLTAPAKVTIVTTSSGDETDTAVDLQSSGGTSVLMPAGPINDGGCFPLFGLGCGEQVQSPMLAAGTYWVQITAGADFDAATNAYTALIFLN
jgi:hypothetical protein